MKMKTRRLSMETLITPSGDITNKVKILSSKASNSGSL